DTCRNGCQLRRCGRPPQPAAVAPAKPAPQWGKLPACHPQWGKLPACHPQWSKLLACHPLSPLLTSRRCSVTLRATAAGLEYRTTPAAGCRRRCELARARPLLSARVAWRTADWAQMNQWGHRSLGCSRQLLVQRRLSNLEGCDGGLKVGWKSATTAACDY